MNQLAMLVTYTMIMISYHHLRVSILKREIIKLF